MPYKIKEMREMQKMTQIDCAKKRIYRDKHCQTWKVAKRLIQLLPPFKNWQMLYSVE